ncbi:MAG: PASTA domain-containing protein, partial [Acidobacteria bacterium]|nr:PASTA domain-containing protein [Acidobacteriota bacterium]
YAKDGGQNVLIASFYAQNRQVVAWNEISQITKNAAIAGEDVRYYEHGAIDPVGIARAAVANLAGKSLQGASTITQQYVKNVCVQEAENLSTQKAVDAAYADCTDPSVGRKLKEARLAIALEKKYSKNQILLGYLNIAGFGGRIYGIESAAEYYYDTTAAKLTIAQAASLIAIVNNPTFLRLDDTANLAGNKSRRDYILGVELRNRLISKADYTTAVATPILPKITQTTSGCQSAGVAGFFCDYVVRSILSSPQFGSNPTTRLANLQRSGWKIYTTLDMSIEKKAQRVMNTYVPKTSVVFSVGSASVSVEVGTGRIISMVQNKDYNDSSSNPPASDTAINYNADAALGASNGWQPGSTFKLFTLLQWLKTGHTLNETVDGNPGIKAASSFTVCGKNYATLGGQDWNVGNDPGDPGGMQTVMRSTALSINGAFASMAQQLDLCDIQNLAESMGIAPAAGPTFPTIVAPMVIGGSYGVAPVAMAGAYATIANNGVYCKPVVIDKVVKTDGSQLAVPQAGCTRVIDQGVAVAAAYALRSVMTSGTAGGDNTADGIYELGKTGTTDNAYDTWMDGTTSKVTTVVWVGNNGRLANKPLQGLRLTSFTTTPCYLSGNGTAAIARHCLWHDIQAAINAEYGGATSWAQPDPQYLNGGTAVAPGIAPATPATPAATGTVPDVTGQSPAAAEAALVAAGYSWALNGTTTSTQPVGTVAATSPAAGSALAPHSQVTIQTSG